APRRATCRNRRAGYVGGRVSHHHWDSYSPWPLSHLVPGYGSSKDRSRRLVTLQPGQDILSSVNNDNHAKRALRASFLHCRNDVALGSNRHGEMAMTVAMQTSQDDGLLVNRTHLPFTLDQGIAHRARIGLIVLATDNTLEYECRRIFTL